MSSQRSSLEFASLALPMSRAPSIAVKLPYQTTILSDLRSLLTSADRIVLDLYWNGKNWQLCPKQYPDTIPQGDELIDLNGTLCHRNPILFESVILVIDQFFTDLVKSIPKHMIEIILNLNDLGTGTATKTIGSVIQQYDGVYTPMQLAIDRQKGVTSNVYFNTTFGYPTLLDLFDRDYYCLFAFGTNTLRDTAGYNITRDQDYVFNQTTLGTIPSLSTSVLEQFTCVNPLPSVSMAGTGFDSKYPQFTSNTTSGRFVSWNYAYIADTPEKPFTSTSLQQIINCGFSPYFTQNFTLDLFQATVWNWKSTEPATDYTKNCVILDQKWQTESCSKKYPIACRSDSDPYQWTINQTLLTFVDAYKSCPPNTTFAAPRSPQEQQMLLSVYQQPVWIEFSRPDIFCWTTSQISSCPRTNTYALIASNLKQGIFLLCVFMIFLVFQCRAQIRFRRETVRRQTVRKKVKQLEYKSMAKTSAEQNY